MDSQERHDLQENDLAEFLANFGEWWQRYGNIVLSVAMVVVLVAAAWRFIGYRSATAHESAWADLASATSPESYQAVAVEHDLPAVQALAYLHGADLLLGQALRPDAAIDAPADDAAGDADGDTAALDAPPADRQALLEDARGMYEDALGVAPHVLYRLNARLGLASVAETQGRWDDARAQYEQVIDAAGATYPQLAEQARVRLSMLEDLSDPVVFAPAARSSPSDASGDATSGDGVGAGAGEAAPAADLPMDQGAGDAAGAVEDAAAGEPATDDAATDGGAAPADDAPAAEAAVTAPAVTDDGQ